MTSFTNKPWDGDAARFSIQQWKRSTLIDTGEGDPDSKGRYKLPVQEPDGTVNTNALSSALAALHGGRGGGVKAPSSEKSKALAAIKRLQAQAKSKK